MRTCLAVMEEAQPALLQVEDFESIITHLKVRGGCGGGGGCWGGGARRGRHGGRPR
jgi:hypothetical protein